MRVELNEFPEVAVTFLWNNEQERMRAAHIEVDILKRTGSLISSPIPPGDGSKGRRLTFHDGTHSNVAIAAVLQMLSGYKLPLAQTSPGVWVASDAPAVADPSPRQVG